MSLAFRHRAGNVIASSVAGGLILVFLAAIVFLLPDATDFQRGLVRFFMSVASGLFATFFIGGIALQGRIFGNTIGAGGGFVLFVLLQFVVNPWASQSFVADRAPDFVGKSADIMEAQTLLKKRGAYSGAVDGVPGSATRIAIENFQRAKGLQPTGFLNTQTISALRLADIEPAPPATYPKSSSDVESKQNPALKGGELGDDVLISVRSSSPEPFSESTTSGNENPQGDPLPTSRQTIDAYTATFAWRYSSADPIPVSQIVDLLRPGARGDWFPFRIRAYYYTRSKALLDMSVLRAWEQAARSGKFKTVFELLSANRKVIEQGCGIIRYKSTWKASRSLKARYVGSVGDRMYVLRCEFDGRADEGALSNLGLVEYRCVINMRFFKLDNGIKITEWTSPKGTVGEVEGDISTAEKMGNFKQTVLDPLQRRLGDGIVSNSPPYNC